MSAYVARNGLTLESSETPWGWSIKSGEDIVLALEGAPALATVASAFILEALAQAMEERKTYRDIEELAAFLAENYL